MNEVSEIDRLRSTTLLELTDTLIIPQSVCYTTSSPENHCTTFSFSGGWWWWCSNKVCPRSTNKLRHSSYHKILIRPHERLFLRQRSLNWTEKLRRIVMFFSIALRAELLLDWHGKTLKLPASFVCNLFMFPIFLSLSLAFVARLLKHLLMSIRA